MLKEEILNFIKTTTNENNGIPLGEKKFYEKTPIKKSDWYGKIWFKWNDAITEAGYKPHEFFNEALSKNVLKDSLIKIIEELDRFPTDSELKFYHINKNNIPSTTVIKKYLGRKHEMAEALFQYCEDITEHNRVKVICSEIISSRKVSNNNKTDKKNTIIHGSVYLMKSGKYYKIGKAEHVGQRNYTIGIKLPEKIEIIHEIHTDDPFGIEKYWHNRFKDKRKEGEWFDLNSEDIEIFKRRKNFM